MTAATLEPTRGGSARRMLSLARAETKLLVRNRTAVVNSLLLPIILVVFFWYAMPGEAMGGSMMHLLTMMLVFTLLFVTYYNLVTTYVARRQDSVLKRMQTGELTDAEILLGTAVPTMLVSLVQIGIVTLGLGLLGELVMPTNLILIALALVGGTALMIGLAAASTVFTRTAETAQITTLPLIMVSMGLSGLFFPLSILPDALATISRFLPVTPVVELSNLGLFGQTAEQDVVGFADTFSHAALPTAVLIAWILIGVYLTRDRFRWSPRA
ncbi:MAG TPA: ABC transporter permease [Jiangellaceae bacterium]|nr:ABC transporter permease [Jiangellaceae bacterium]